MRTILWLFSLVLFCPTVSLAGWFGPSDYEECILESMKGVSSNAAAIAIAVACKKKFPPQKEKKGLISEAADSFSDTTRRLSDYYTNTLPTEKVLVDVGYASKACNEKLPLAVFITNGSSKTVSLVNFDISVKIPGRSTDLVQHQYPPAYKSDRLIKPGETSGDCWSLPDIFGLDKGTPIKDLDYGIINKSVIFQ